MKDNHEKLNIYAVAFVYQSQGQLVLGSNWLTAPANIPVSEVTSNAVKQYQNEFNVLEVQVCLSLIEETKVQAIINNNCSLD